jgi:hypothetical protein
LNQRLAKQVRHLLEKSRYPSVEVKKSCLSGAGRGVFSRLSVSDEMLPMVACLYPGIYTPGIPYVDSAEIGNHYLADQIPPSQIPFENNEYIVNLQDTGGYVDGSSLEDCNGRRLDTIPLPVDILLIMTLVMQTLISFRLLGTISWLVSIYGMVPSILTFLHFRTT